MRLSDRVLRDALAVAGHLDVAERWASGWLGQAWVAADLGEREPEHQLCLEVVGRVCSRSSPHGLVAVAALRRVAPPGEGSMLDGTVEILAKSQPRAALAAGSAVHGRRGLAGDGCVGQRTGSVRRV